MRLRGVSIWLGMVLILGLGPVQGAVYSGADLPGVGQTLDIFEGSTLRIAAGETGDLGGMIFVHGGAHLQWIVEGQLQVGDAGGVTAEGGRVDISGSGAVQGGSLHLLTKNGGSLNWKVENEVSLAGLSIENLMADATLAIQGRLSIQHFEIDNNAGGAVTLQNDGVLEVTESAIVDSSNLSEGGTYLHFRRLTTIADLNLKVHNGDVELTNSGLLTLADMAMTATGWGTVTVSNAGLGWIGVLVSSTYGAHCNVQNVGALTIDDWLVKDQNDASEIVAIGNLDIRHLAITANGAAGSARWTSLGEARVETLSLDANYGGQIELDASAGGLEVHNLACESSGSSHGQSSRVLVRLGRRFQADHATVNSKEQVLNLTAGEILDLDDGAVRFEAGEQSLVGTGSPLVYPQLALGGGYEVVLIVTNKTEVPWSGTASLRRESDLDFVGEWSLVGGQRQGSEFRVELEGNESKKFVVSGGDTVQAGYLILRADQGGNTRSISTSFFYNFLTGGHLMDSTGVPPAVPAVSFCFPVEKTALANTGLAWVSPGSVGNFDVKVELYGPKGDLVAESTTSFDGHEARFFAGPDGLFPEVPDGFVGKIVIHADESLDITVLRLELTNSGFQLTSVPPDDFVP